MKTLTKPSSDGHGYSIESEDLTNGIYKLGRIEHKAYDLIEEICDSVCKFRDVYHGVEGGQERLLARCEHCPLDKLHDLIYKGDSHETPGKAF